MGHLSNHETAGLLREIVAEDCRAVILAHLSEQNNTRALARRAASNALLWSGAKRVEMRIAEVRRPSPEVRVLRPQEAAVIERYTRKEMGELWSDQARLSSWLEVELAVCEALAARHRISADEMAQIRERAAFDVERIAEIEATVGHDVIAFVTSVAEKVGPAGRHIHFGLTSSDVVDTAQALRTVRAADLLLDGLQALRTALRRRAEEHRATVMVGRTHGIHAEPYTLGLKFAGWYAEAGRNIERLQAAREEIRHGKISGSVGAYAHLGPEIESEVLERLRLSVEPVSTQVVPRDRLAQFSCGARGSGVVPRPHRHGDPSPAAQRRS